MGFPILPTASNCQLLQDITTRHRSPSHVSAEASVLLFLLGNGSGCQKWPQACCPPHKQWLQFDTFMFCINDLFNSGLQQLEKRPASPEAAGASQSVVCEMDRIQQKILRYM